MIYIRIEMWPVGSLEQRRILGEAVIANIGGTKTLGNYEAILSKRGGFKSDEKSMSRMNVRNVWKKLEIHGFKRKQKGFWQLMTEVLVEVCKKKI